MALCGCVYRCGAREAVRRLSLCEFKAMCAWCEVIVVSLCLWSEQRVKHTHGPTTTTKTAARNIFYTSFFFASFSLGRFSLASPFVRSNFFRIHFVAPLLVHKVVGFISSFRNMFMNMYDINKYMWKRRSKVDWRIRLATKETSRQRGTQTEKTKATFILYELLHVFRSVLSLGLIDMSLWCCCCCCWGPYKENGKRFRRRTRKKNRPQFWNVFDTIRASLVCSSLIIFSLLFIALCF